MAKNIFSKLKDAVKGKDVSEVKDKEVTSDQEQPKEQEMVDNVSNEVPKSSNVDIKQNAKSGKGAVDNFRARLKEKQERARNAQPKSQFQ